MSGPSPAFSVPRTRSSTTRRRCATRPSRRRWRTTPRPSTCSRAELENIAFPVEEQGIGALEAALDTAFKLGIYSPYTIEIEDRLRKFKPAKFGRIYELPFFPSAAVSANTRTASLK